MLKYLVVAAVAATLLPTVAPARETPPTVRVAYRDLDLNSAQGVRILDRRIADAAAQLCPDAPRVGITRNLAVEKCRIATQASVAQQRAAAIASATRGNGVLVAR
jgi:UrcA family protein